MSDTAALALSLAILLALGLGFALWPDLKSLYQERKPSLPQGSRTRKRMKGQGSFG